MYSIRERLDVVGEIDVGRLRVVEDQTNEPFTHTLFFSDNNIKTLNSHFLRKCKRNYQRKPSVHKATINRSSASVMIEFGKIGKLDMTFFSPQSKQGTYICCSSETSITDRITTSSPH